MIDRMPSDRRRLPGRTLNRAAGTAMIALSALGVATWAGAETLSPPRPKPLAAPISASLGPPAAKPDWITRRAPAAADPAPEAEPRSAPAATASAPATGSTGTGPRRKPDGVSPVPHLALGEFRAFEKALAAALRDDFAGALGQVDRVGEPTARTLIEWLYMRSDTLKAGPQRISDFLSRHPEWPDAHVLRTRAEASLYVSPPGARATIAYFERFAPTTGTGMVSLASAYLEAGDKAKATGWFVRAWREERLSESLEDWLGFIVNLVEVAVREGSLPADTNATQLTFELTAVLEYADLLFVLQDDRQALERARVAVAAMLPRR